MTLLCNVLRMFVFIMFSTLQSNPLIMCVFIMSDSILIGVSGRAGSGKSTVATYLQQSQFVKIAFADSLKEAAQVLFDFSTEQLYNSDLKHIEDYRWGVSPRKALQLLGDDFARGMIHPDFWVMKAQHIINQCIGKGRTKLVVEDLRYDNEKAMILRNGGYILHIQRDNNPYKISTEHLSEKGITLDHTCTIIDNNTTCEDLFEKVDNYLLQLR